MKLLASLFIIFAFVCCASAQEKWTRIANENNNFAVSFPPGFVVDAEKRERGQRYRIFGFQNGVKMELRVYSDGDAKGRLRKLFFGPGTGGMDFTAGDFKGKKTSSGESGSSYFERLYIASEDFFYDLEVKAESKNKEELKRFLYSIHLGGKPLFVQTEKKEFEEDFAALGTLKTYPDVTEAFSRKLEKTKKNVTYEAYSPQMKFKETDKLSRPVIIVDKPSPRIAPPTSMFEMRNMAYEAKLQVDFLANGQIGDIVVYSNSPKNITEEFVDAARKIRFVPAQIDGKNVDATVMVEYKFTISFSTF